MNRIYKTVLVLALICASISCTNMLEQTDPTARDPNLFPENEVDLNSMLASAYSGLTAGNPNNSAASGEGFYSGGGVLTLGYLGDNLYRTGNFTDGDWGFIGPLLYTTEDKAIELNYQYLYRAVSRANQVIAAAPGVVFENDPNNVMKTTIVAEARFLRALSYFHLTLLWGEVPLQLEDEIEDTDGLLDNPAEPAENIYSQIIADLLFSIDNLPDEPVLQGRVDVWGAKALLSKVYLFGGDELGETSWYALSESLAADVINNSQYAIIDGSGSLHDDYMELFDVRRNGNSEMIFEVQHFNKGGNWDNSAVATRFNQYTLPWYSLPTKAIGWGWAYVYESAIAQWDDVDPRKHFSVFINGDSISDVDSDAQDGYADGITNFTTDNASLHMGRIVRPTSGGIQKFWWTEALGGHATNSDQNWPIIRLADILLIHAEADLMTDGNLSSQGLESINIVRRRADLPDLTSADRDDILEERRWELFSEGHRWYDLMRTKKAEEAFAFITQLDTDNNDNDKVNFQSSRHYKFPYPFTATVANQGLTQKDTW